MSMDEKFNTKCLLLCMKSEKKKKKKEKIAQRIKEKEPSDKKERME